MRSTCSVRTSRTFQAPSVRALVPAWLLVLPGCTAFTAVRSAEVVPGRSLDVGMTVATPPGDDAAWFWAFDCASECDHTIPAVDVGFTSGHVPEGSGRPFELGVGLSGFYPYAHAYVQLREGRRPFGVGGRVGVLPLGSWFEGSLFGRQDVPLGRRTRLLLSPGVFWHGGSSPNRANPGRFIAATAGIGLEHATGDVSIAPTVLLVAGRVDRSSYGRPVESSTAFLVVGLTARFGRSPRR